MVSGEHAHHRVDPLVLLPVLPSAGCGSRLRWPQWRVRPPQFFTHAAGVNLFQSFWGLERVPTLAALPLFI
jgi:hypothetical protein